MSVVVKAPKRSSKKVTEKKKRQTREVTALLDRSLDTPRCPVCGWWLFARMTDEGPRFPCNCPGYEE